MNDFLTLTYSGHLSYSGPQQDENDWAVGWAMQLLVVIMKVAHWNSFQNISRHRFWCVITTTLSVDVTIMVSKHCPIMGERIGIIFAPQYITIVTVWLAKNILHFSLKNFYFKKMRISRIRCNFWQSLKKNIVGVESHLKLSKNRVQYFAFVMAVIVKEHLFYSLHIHHHKLISLESSVVESKYEACLSWKPLCLIVFVTRMTWSSFPIKEFTTKVFYGTIDRSI